MACCEGLACDEGTSQCVEEEATCANEGEECIEAGCCEGLTCDGESSQCIPA